MNQLVYLKHDEAVCDSLQVAERFEKQHGDVMHTIFNQRKNALVKVGNHGKPCIYGSGWNFPLLF